MSEPGWLAHGNSFPRPWPSAAILVWPEWPLTDVKRPPTTTRAARADTRDWTPYVVVTPAGRTEPLRMRRAVLAMVSALHQAGVPASQLVEVLTRSKFDQ